MKFTYEGKNYFVEFERSNRVPDGSIVDKKRTYTTAKVLESTGPLNTDLKVVRSYEVGVYHKDRFNYEVGRKAALEMALYDAPTMRGGKPILGVPLSRDFKTAVWRAYHTRQGSPVKWVEPVRG